MGNSPVPKGTILDFHGTRADGKGGTMPNPTREYHALPMTPLNGTEWKPVDFPGIAPGYQISLYGELKSPKGNPVKRQVRKGRVVMALRQADHPTGNSTSVQLAVLVLSTFDHYAPHLVPEHKDGDSLNCHLSNLYWREPTAMEARAKRSLASARAARKESTKKRRRAPASAPVTPATTPRSPVRVEMFRTYRAGGLEILVTPNGEIPAGGLPKGKLTPLKVAALSEILKDVVEMNRLMGAEGEL